MARVIEKRHGVADDDGAGFEPSRQVGPVTVRGDQVPRTTTASRPSSDLPTNALMSADFPMPDSPRTCTTLVCPSTTWSNRAKRR